MQVRVEPMESRFPLKARSVPPRSLRLSRNTAERLRSTALLIGDPELRQALERLARHGEGSDR